MMNTGSAPSPWRRAQALALAVFAHAVLLVLLAAAGAALVSAA
jgi:hypothetical protein